MPATVGRTMPRLEDPVGTQPRHPVAPVRKIVIGREDVSRRPFTPRPRWAAPRWLRRVISGLLALFILPWLLGVA